MFTDSDLKILDEVAFVSSKREKARLMGEVYERWDSLLDEFFSYLSENRMSASLRITDCGSSLTVQLNPGHPLNPTGSESIPLGVLNFDSKTHYTQPTEKHELMLKYLKQRLKDPESNPREVYHSIIPQEKKVKLSSVHDVRQAQLPEYSRALNSDFAKNNPGLVNQDRRRKTKSHF